MKAKSLIRRVKTRGTNGSSFSGLKVGNVTAGVSKGKGYRSVSVDTPRTSRGVSVNKVNGGVRVTAGSDINSKSVTVRQSGTGRKRLAKPIAKQGVARTRTPMRPIHKNLIKKGR